MSVEKKIKKIETKKKNPKSWMKWSWAFVFLFFALSFLNIRFALAGFICMAAPITYALSGRGKIHCSHYCPRGSFLGMFLKYISLRKTLPAFMTTKAFKNLLLIFMFSAFGVTIYRMGTGYENLAKAMYTMMLRSFFASALIGVIFMPRSWCKICPMGHAAGLIRDRGNIKKGM